MELLLYNITEKEKNLGSRDFPADISALVGVTVKSDDISKIEWVNFKLEGTFELRWIPRTAWVLNVYWNRLHGSLDFIILSEKLIGG